MVELNYEMVIDDVSLLRQKTGEAFCSPVFFAKTNENIRWRLHLYPNGAAAETKDFFGFFIQRIAAEKDFPVTAKYRLTIHKNGREVLSQSGAEQLIEFRTTD